MNNPVLDNIKNRHCKRSFLPKEVPNDILQEVLVAAANAPSAKNMQPWQVAVVRGQALQSLMTEMLQDFDTDKTEISDYQYTTEPVPDIFMQRARKTGYDIFALKGIDQNDAHQRQQHRRENFRFFGAPLQLIFMLPKDSERGSFLDLGLYMQNVMLGLLSAGIDSCPQASITVYSNTIRKVLNISDNLWIVSGLACGYADDNKVNSFIPQRLELHEYVTFHE